MKSPTVTSDPFNILRDCSKKMWEATKQNAGEDAELIMNMKCPIELQEIELINGFGEFQTKEFSVYGSHNSTGIWNMLFEGTLDQESAEVR